MITVSIQNLTAVQNTLKKLATDQIPYATMITLNNTAFKIQKASKERFPIVFDRPTPLTQGATSVVKATKQMQQATIYIQPKRAVVLKTHEIGGPRRQKGFERKVGLSNEWRAVPTKKMPLNKYGNPDSTLNKRILAAKTGRARGIYFIMPGVKSAQSPGIYQLVSKIKIDKLYHFVKQVQYSPVLSWSETAKSNALELLPGEVENAVKRVLATI